MTPYAVMRVRNSNDIGALIRDHRRRLGLTQEALAERVGVSRQWLGDVERGKASAELGLVLRVVNALGVRLVVVEEDEERAAAPGIVNVDAIVRGATERGDD